MAKHRFYNNETAIVRTYKVRDLEMAIVIITDTKTHELVNVKEFKITNQKDRYAFNKFIYKYSKRLSTYKSYLFKDY